MPPLKRYDVSNSSLLSSCVYVLLATFVEDSIIQKLGRLFYERDVVVMPGSLGGLEINHYAIQSKEFWEKIKMTRGDSYWVDNVRTWEYFNNYDYAEFQDLELCSILKCCNCNYESWSLGGDKSNITNP